MLRTAQVGTQSVKSAISPTNEKDHPISAFIGGASSQSRSEVGLFQPSMERLHGDLQHPTRHRELADPQQS